jgi:hypothetical protein
MTLVKDQLSNNITHTEKYYTVNKNLSSQVSFEFRTVRDFYGIFFHCQEFFYNSSSSLRFVTFIS